MEGSGEGRDTIETNDAENWGRIYHGGGKRSFAREIESDLQNGLRKDNLVQQKSCKSEIRET